jgi:HK97 family phage major capsid protein
MKMLEILRARLKTLAGEMKTITDKETMTADEMASLGTKSKEISEIEVQIKQIEDAEAVIARTAAPANAPVGTPAQPAEKLTTAHKLGLLAMGMVRALKEEGARGPRATFRHLDEIGYGQVAREFDQSKARALNSTSATAGGILVPETMANDVIDILRPNTTFLAGNPRIIPMPNGSYKVTAAAAGATAAYRGETRAIGVVQPSFKAINMVAKLLGSIVPISDQLLRYNTAGLQAWVERDLSLAMGVRMDSAAYFGSGTADIPLGITNIPGIYSVAATDSATPTIAQIESDAAKLELAMFNTNLPALGVEWRMSRRTFLYMQNLRNANGERVYPELSQTNPVFRTFPVRITNQIADNGGSGTNESKILLVAFGHVMMGDTMAMQMAISDTASVVNGATTINAFQDGITLIKAEMEHDFDVQYLEAVAVLTAVKWGS